MNIAKDIAQQHQLRAFCHEARELINSLGGNVEEAARRLGLDPDTLKAWLADEPPPAERRP